LKFIGRNFFFEAFMRFSEIALKVTVDVVKSFLILLKATK